MWVKIFTNFGNTKPHTLKATLPEYFSAFHEDFQKFHDFSMIKVEKSRFHDFPEKSCFPMIFLELLEPFLCNVGMPVPDLGLYGPRHAKTCLQGFANNTGTDQPAHPRRLISAFIICFLLIIVSRLATRKISIF